MFEAYKQEMEKYLSCFTDESHKKGKTVKKVKTKKVDEIEVIVIDKLKI